ncbi:SUR7/PalI family-domain-containing protein [Lasiosphaeria miniovina]|uniref:SUR7/PalI family-domain-containing protein n=1 Tax=Lasiosphaeria miniovina TaxID=1954250 RepID=A0AA40ECX4_9PEZI|nr:SUR7/PalI family-domain-containing protein [Lasiosphaeria miniovina]KAK0733702.1 SUR7/PalI family-domain-containing protein [Lasiosphaeria miniovina]
MLRPATPLSVLLFAAFCLLLLAVLSTPIIKAVPLGSFLGVNFGVFGWCKGDTCSGIEIGYGVPILATTDSSSFDLPVQTRNTLSAILVIHPVAALITLIMFVLAVIAHLHAPSHSARYLLLVFVVGIIDFLLCLLCFLIDVLLFVPHMAWGSYIVLAATILVALSGLVSCAMRRTVVSRKARKKRIAANAEMSGENYYNRQAQQTVPATTAGALQPTVPVVSGANGRADTLPEFASFEKKDDRSSDERIPLTARSPSDRSPNALTNDVPSGLPDNQSFPSLSNVQTEYGNAQPDGYGVRRGPSFESINSRGRGGGPQGGYRGRGGYSGPGRGGYGGYGPTPPNGRGGYGPPGRGGYGPPPGGRGGYGPLPRGYGGPGSRGGRTPPPPSYQGAAGAYDRRPSPGAAYGPGPYGARQASPGPPSAPGYMTNPPSTVGGYDSYNPDRDSLPRAESPPPLPGVDDGIPSRPVAEMDATSGNSPQGPQGFGQYGIRDSDADVAGMLAMQQARTSTPQRHETYVSEASNYSQQENTYVPPRQAWNQGPGRNSPSAPSLLNPGSRNGPPVPATSEYYEDVDPRFAEPPVAQRPTPPPIHTTSSYEDIPQGSRSPAESERSTFTSISQRGVNPRWAPPPVPNNYGGSVIPRRPVNRPADVLLNSNPDFELPARGSPSRTPGNLTAGGAYPPGVR